MSRVDADPGAVTPAWLFALLALEPLEEGGEATVGGRSVRLHRGILRVAAEPSAAQDQTSDAFGFKWGKRETFESKAMRSRMRTWLVERYGDVENAAWWADHGDWPVVLDAGCGAGFSALELFASRLSRIRYIGVDISTAVDVAAKRFSEHGHPAAFMQADICDLPFPDHSIDVVFSEGVLHHTDSTQGALDALTRLLRVGGRMMFYVYRRKGPIREFSDGFISRRVQALAPEEAWDALLPLTRLGKALGDLDVEVDIPEPIDILEIPAGRISVQRLLYWHFVKAYHHPDYDLEELNHINYDWYAPRNAHRQSIEEVRAWCTDAGLSIEREDVQEAGITVIARKSASPEG